MARGTKDERKVMETQPLQLEEAGSDSEEAAPQPQHHFFPTSKRTAFAIATCFAIVGAISLVAPRKTPLTPMGLVGGSVIRDFGLARPGPKRIGGECTMMCGGTVINGDWGRRRAESVSRIGDCAEGCQPSKQLGSPFHSCKQLMQFNKDLGLPQTCRNLAVKYGCDCRGCNKRAFYQGGRPVCEQDGDLQPYPQCTHCFFRNRYGVAKSNASTNGLGCVGLWDWKLNKEMCFNDRFKTHYCSSESGKVAAPCEAWYEPEQPVPSPAPVPQPPSCLSEKFQFLEETCDHTRCSWSADACWNKCTFNSHSAKGLRVGQDEKCSYEQTCKDRSGEKTGPYGHLHGTKFAGYGKWCPAAEARGNGEKTDPESNKACIWVGSRVDGQCLEQCRSVIPEQGVAGGQGGNLEKACPRRCAWNDDLKSCHEPFIFSDLGEMCPDQYMQIDDSKVCEDASEQVSINGDVKEIEDSAKPSGCFKEGDVAYFNSVDGEKQKDGIRQVCVSEYFVPPAPAPAVAKECPSLCMAPQCTSGPVKMVNGVCPGTAHMPFTGWKPIQCYGKHVPGGWDCSGCGGFDYWSTRNCKLWIGDVKTRCQAGNYQQGCAETCRWLLTLPEPTVHGDARDLEKPPVPLVEAPKKTFEMHLKRKDQDPDCKKGERVGEWECEAAAAMALDARNLGHLEPPFEHGAWSSYPPGCTLKSYGKWSVIYNKNPDGKSQNAYYYTLCDVPPAPTPEPTPMPTPAPTPAPTSTPLCLEKNLPEDFGYLAGPWACSDPKKWQGCSIKRVAKDDEGTYIAAFQTKIYVKMAKFDEKGEPVPESGVYASGKLPEANSDLLEMWKKGNRIGDRYYFVKRDKFQCGPPNEKFYHLAAKGSKKCKHGVGPSEDKCEVAGKKALGDKDDDTVKMESGSWDQGPPVGCSVGHSSSWSVTYNRKDGGDKDGEHYPVCESTVADLLVELSEPEKKTCHLAAKGAASCDFGFSPGQGDCKAKADEAVRAAGKEGGNDLAIFKSPWLPSGCFSGMMRTRKMGDIWLHMFNPNQEGVDYNKKYSLVCCP